MPAPLAAAFMNARGGATPPNDTPYADMLRKIRGGGRPGLIGPPETSGGGPSLIGPPETSGGGPTFLGAPPTMGSGPGLYGEPISLADTLAQLNRAAQPSSGNLYNGFFGGGRTGQNPYQNLIYNLFGGGQLYG